MFFVVEALAQQIIFTGIAAYETWGELLAATPSEDIIRVTASESKGYGEFMAVQAYHYMYLDR